MLRNYLKISFRNLKKYKGYSFINIAGLAIGMAACITIFMFVKHEYSYDSFNKKADRIYRVNVGVNIDSRSSTIALTPAPLGPFLKDQFPQIKHVVRLVDSKLFSPTITPVLRSGDKVLRANQFLFADSSFFDVFSFKMISGNLKTALDAPFSVVLTKDAAQRLFGNEDPIGKTITYNSKFTFEVTGVIDNPPSNSTIQFDYLGSFSSLPTIWNNPQILKSRLQFNYYTYILLNQNSSIESIEKQAPHELKKYWDANLISEFGTPKLHFEKLRNQYWDNSVSYDIPVKGDRNTIAAFIVIAVVILLIACANFINLSTARALTRAKEIGIRKAIGGQRIQIIKQFMFESILMSLIALLSAVALSEFLIPVINTVLGTSLKINYLHGTDIVFTICGILILTSLLSGLLPAFFLSSFQPVSTLKGNMNNIKGKKYGRQFFILFQFSAVIVLTFCTIVVTKEYNFLKFHNVGFDKNNIITLKYDQNVNGNYIPFKQILMENHHILGVAAAEDMPGDTYPTALLFFRGKNGAQNEICSLCSIDPDYIKVLDMKLLAGRDFSSNYQKNGKMGVILNEAAAKKLGWTPSEAIGKPFGFMADSLNGQVIGVVSDFNFQSLHSKIEPLALTEQSNVQSLAVKISSDNVASTLGYIENTWKKMFPNNPIQYGFLDKSLDALYKSEQRLNILFTWFSPLSIIIACLGLYGLILYTAERKTKEIGVRKVLGASVPGVIILLVKEFAKWVLIANIIAWPIAYYFMHNWLQNFAYKINISWWLFILAGGIAFTIALLTVSFQAIKAATANPVESLRYE